MTIESINHTANKSTAEKKEFFRVLQFNAREWSNFNRFFRISCCLADIVEYNNCKYCQNKVGKLSKRYVKLWNQLQKEVGATIKKRVHV